MALQSDPTRLAHCTHDLTSSDTSQSDLQSNIWREDQAGLVTVASSSDFLMTALSFITLLQQVIQTTIVEKHHHGPSARFDKAQKEEAAAHQCCMHLTRMKRIGVACSRCKRTLEREVVGGADVAAAVRLLRLAFKPHITTLILWASEPESLIPAIEIVTRKCGVRVVIPYLKRPQSMDMFVNETGQVFWLDLTQPQPSLSQATVGGQERTAIEQQAYQATVPPRSSFEYLQHGLPQYSKHAIKTAYDQVGPDIVFAEKFIRENGLQ
eukprot:m.43930 g.43930  ORF g.43930 m.43930 type:complete len:267 (-) comp10807_c0_seq1:2472-3272(-)